MRQWADPTALERLALWGEGSIPTSGAGPAAVSSATTRCTPARLCPPGWPDRRLARIDVATEWMYPLLSTALPGSVRTVSMHLEAVSTEQAFAEVRDARTTGGMAQHRARTRRGSSPPRRRNDGSTRPGPAKRELTRGFRQHKIAGLVMVSSPDAETAGRAWRQAERKAVECHLDSARCMSGVMRRGRELPLCRLRFTRGLL